MIQNLFVSFFKYFGLGELTTDHSKKIDAQMANVVIRQRLADGIEREWHLGPQEVVSHALFVFM